MSTWTDLIKAVAAAGGDSFTAAMTEPAIFKTYFSEHVGSISRLQGQTVWPVGYGIEGAFMLGALGVGGYGYNNVADTWHEPLWLGDPQDPGGEVIVFGLDQGRVDLIKTASEAHGLTVVRTVRMADDMVTDF